MGNSRSMSSLEVTRPSQPKEWVKERTTGYCDVVRNTHTGLLAEQYSVAVDGRLGRDENLRRYEFRFTHCQYTVQVIQVEKEDSQFLCQGQDFLRVKTELIPKRLSELGKLSHEEGLYVLSRALNGYKAIFEFHGPVAANDDMVGVTEDGRVKVWLNENFAKNLPDNDVKDLHHSQTIMIDEILEMVEEHVQGGYPHKFKDQLKQTPPNNFQEALELLNAYVTRERVRMPPFLGSTTANTIRVITSQPAHSTQPAHHSTHQPAQSTYQATQPSQFTQSSNTITIKRSEPASHVISPKSQLGTGGKAIGSGVTVTKIEAPKAVYMKPLTAVSPDSPDRPKPTTNSITINIPGSNYYSASIRQQPSISISNPQQQSQITQSRNIQAQVIRPMTQASQPRIVASKSNAQLYQYQGTSRVVQDVSSSLTSSQKLIQPARTVELASQHIRQPSTLVAPSQGSSQVRQPPSATSTVKFYSGGIQKVAQVTPVAAMTSSTNAATTANSMGTSKTTSTTTSTPKIATIKEQQPRKAADSGTVNREAPLDPQKAQGQNEPKEHGLQHQIQKLKEVSKMIGQPPKPKQLKIEGNVSFVSPMTESKRIKFEQSTPKQKQQIFVKAQPTVITPSKPFLKKELVTSSADQNKAQTNTQSSPLGFGKAKVIGSPTVQVIKAGTRTVQKQDTIQSWTAPKQVTTMEAIKTRSPSSKPVTDSHISSTSEAKAIAKSEIEQLDALQNRLSEMVNKISTNAETQ